MEWPPNSPDLNPIENMWSIIKRKVYANGKQFRSKNQLWNAIQAAAKGISTDEVLKLTSSMDRRLIAVVARHGAYIKHWLSNCPIRVFFVFNSGFRSNIFKLFKVAF